MNQIASLNASRRPPVALPSVLATLDLADERQRILHSAMQRMHTGRWPLFRALGMRQEGRYIYEAVRWRPTRQGSPQFALVLWDLHECGLSWQDAGSPAAALAALRAAYHPQ